MVQESPANQDGPTRRRWQLPETPVENSPNGGVHESQEVPPFEPFEPYEPKPEYVEKFQDGDGLTSGRWDEENLVSMR